MSMAEALIPDSRHASVSNRLKLPLAVAVLLLASGALLVCNWQFSGSWGASMAEPPQRADHLGLFVDGQTYSHVQYLGFNLFTAPGTEADGCFSEVDVLDECYLGSDKVKEDIRRRVEILVEALESVFASGHWERSPSTLKVFLAPEFYWRGSKGAYRISPALGNISTPIVSEIVQFLSHPRFKHWLVVPGTVVAAQEADARYVQMSERPFEHISYYNFAPVHIGGTDHTFVQFKHFISGIDFLKAQPEHTRAIEPPPGLSEQFCKKHPDSNGCIYKRMPHSVLAELGFKNHQILEDGILHVGGLKVGLEVCLDHAKGELCKAVGGKGTVDLQLVVSAGMNVASGPVCTAANGPVLLADGFARTELSLNQFGHGRESALLPGKQGRRYNVGIVYGSDAMVSLEQWIGDAISAVTGTGFGTRFPGQGTLPGGSANSGDTGIPFKQVAALGEDWLEQLTGFYNTASYATAQRADEVLQASLRHFEERRNVTLSNAIERAKLYPTVDIYGPIALPQTGSK